MAISRVRLQLALEIRAEANAEPSLLWKQRVTNRRISVSATHPDYPALLTEVLDLLQHNGFSTSSTAQQLGVSTSQLVKFLKVERAVLGKVNHERQQLGKPLLH